MEIMFAWGKDKYLSDCDTGWATKLFLTEICAEIIASGTSCLCMRSKGGFVVFAETIRGHTFQTEISEVILAAMVLAPNFCCKNCQRVISAVRGNLP